MFFKQPDLTSGSRPVLEPDEILLFVQDGVGLYEGKFKIADCQNGHAYLTSHRVCYVDNKDPRKNSLAIDLRDVDRHEYQAKFLRSSPKITFYPKALKRGFSSLRQPSAASPNVQRLQASSSSPVSRTASPFRAAPVPVAPSPVTTGNWICPICSFNNPVPSNFDPKVANEGFPLPPCLTCGIKPPFAIVLRAAISANTNRIPATQPEAPPHTHRHSSDLGRPLPAPPPEASTCPRCTFHNHPSLQTCEICGAALPNSFANRPLTNGVVNGRSESPGPEIASLRLDDGVDDPSVKFSFRAGGDRALYDRLKNAMIQRKWLAASAPPAPKPLDSLRLEDDGTGENGSPERGNRSPGVGIAGLEQRGLQKRMRNQAVIGTAFEDLEALMASARDIVILAEKFATESRRGTAQEDSMDPVLSESAAALSIIATKDMLSDGSHDLYISSLSRILAEYVTDERRGVLRRQGGIMSLVDLWATYNKSRNGVELASPSDFHKAAEMWATLGLPVRLRQFKSGLLVVQRYDWNDEKIIVQLKNWLDTLRRSPPEESEWDWARFGCGVNAQDAAFKFGWSLGVATEELEMAEEKGVLCREEGIEGLKFWLNYIVEDD